MEIGHSREAMLAFAYREYSATDPREIATARLGQARVLKKMGQQSSAAKILDETALFGLPDSLVATLLYEGMLNHYLAHEPAEVTSRYAQGEELLEASDYKLLSELLTILAYLDLESWPEAKTTGLQYIQDLEGMNLLSSDSAYSERWIDFFESDNQPHLKNPKLARILSMVLPGLGQIYAGDVFEGTTNILIIGALAGATVFAGIQGYYVTAWLGGLGLLQRFYFGGIERAEELSTKKNRQRIETYLMPVKTFLIKLSSPTFDPST